MDEDSFQGEPQVALAPDGTLYTYTRPGVLRSDDGGLTWTDPVLPAPGLTSDQTLHVAPDGTVWYAMMAYAYGGQAAARSDDRGTTWTAHPFAADLPGVDRPYVVGEDAATAHIAYHSVTRGRTVDHVVATRDGGFTWSLVHTGDHALDVDTPDGRSFWFGDGLRAADGTMAFPAAWYEQPTAEPLCEGQPCYQRWSAAALTSTDLGATWSWWVAPPGEGEALGVQLVRGAFGPAGGLYLAWASVVDGDTAVWVSWTDDEGVTWQEPMRVDDGQGAAAFPNVAVGPTGRVAVTYYEADEGGAPGGVSEDAAWRVTLVVLDRDDLGATPIRGNLTDEPIRYGPICVDGGTCEGDREFLDFFDMVALPDGRVGIVYNILPRYGNGQTDLQNWFAVTEEPVFGAVDGT